MKRWLGWAVLCGAFLLGAVARAPAAPADEPADGPVARIVGDVDVSPTGDGQAKIQIRFDPKLYEGIKKNVPDPRRFLQDLRSGRADFELGTSSAVYDDAETAVVLELLQLGLARDRGDGLWELAMEAGFEFTKASPADAPQQTAHFTETGTWEGGAKYVGEYAYRLPKGASDARWDGERRVLTWRLRYQGGTGTARITADLRVRDRLMSTVYKVYGLGTDFSAQWVAKAVFRNEGTAVARNLKVRYRLQGYGEWSPWEKIPEVVPGQTVVSVNYPVVDASIAKLKSNTPANLLLEWSYDDGTGTRKEDDDAKKVVLLGVNEFVFSSLTAGESFGTWQEGMNNAPLLAAWVTRNDPIVKQFAAMANKNAGGVGASTDVRSAVAVLKACYELLLLNDFSYQHPPSLQDKTVSFDAHMVQNVKLPRDTIRDRSGTCIDLAILYAALVNAVGLEPRLALIPGHCFPVVKLPDGSLVAVETTGVSGGVRFGSAGFDRVFEYGAQELKKAQEDGRIYLIDVQSLWTRGVSNPELDDLPPNILQLWGLSEAGRGGAQGSPSAPRPGPSPSAPTAPAAEGTDGVLGLWGGPIDPAATIGEGVTLTQLIVGVEKGGPGYRAGVRMDLTVKTPQGETKVAITGVYEGTVEGDAVVLKSGKRERTILATGAKDEIAGNTIVVQPGEGRITGKIGDDDGWLPFTLVPKRDDASAPTPAPTEPETVDPLAKAVGMWGGRLDATVEGGAVVKQLVLGIDREANGTYKAGMMTEIAVRNGGSTTTFEIVSRFTGKVDGGRLRFTTDTRVRKDTTTGEETTLRPATMFIELVQGGVKGRIGNDTDGWTDFTLAPKKD